MKPSNEKEDSLALRAKQDPKALGRLFGRYQKAVDAKVSRMLPKNHWEDGAQEAYLALYQAVRHFDPQRKIQFSTYAGRCIDNALRNYQVKLSTKKSQLNASSVSLEQMRPEEQPQTEAPSPDQMLIDKEQYHLCLEQIRQSLSPFESKVFHCYLNGDDYRQIATRLGVGEKSVSNALVRIRRKLKTVFVDT